MKKNPVIPYAMIAVLGIVAMIILASVGVNQMEEVKGDHGNEEPKEEEVVTDPDAIFQNNCSMCHGADLAGTSMAPALNTIGGTLSKDEIKDVIINGRPGTAMTPGYATAEEAEILAEWLSQKK